MAPDSTYITTSVAVRAGYYVYPGSDRGAGPVVAARILPDSGFVIGIAPKGTTAAGDAWVRLLGYFAHKRGFAPE
jgi:hypothetical protein